MKHLPVPFGILLVLAALSSCVPQIKPNVWSDDLYSANKPVIYLLPLADMRPDTTESGNFDRWSSNTLRNVLKRKGYKTVKISRKESQVSVEEDQLRGLRDTTTTDEEKRLIGQIGPDQARWLLLPVLTDVRKSVALGCKATCDINGYLFDKQTGRTVLWHKAQGDGSVGLLLCPLAPQMAVENAFTMLGYAFPKNPPAKK